jgi:hypothetical protein
MSAASSTPPAVTAQPVDNTSAPLAGVTPSKSTSAPKPPPIPPKKRNDSIIGYDSIIRMPIKALPTTPPTPNRE